MPGKEDVYAYGMICPSRLVVLKSAFPNAGQYAEIASTHLSLGGEAANSSVVLAALGLTVRLDGNWLPSTSHGRETANLLSGFGIDTKRILFKTLDDMPEELVVAFRNERTIFGKYQELFRHGKRWSGPRESDVKDSRIVCLDPFFRKESLKVAHYAKTHRKPYITVDADFADPLAHDAAVIVISNEYHRRRYRRLRAAPLFCNYQKRCHGLVVITSGERDILYGRNGASIKHYRPPVIRPVDTSGAGDSFRAGMVYGVLNDLSDDESIRFSAGLAALNCLRFPGVLNSPSAKEVYSFLKSRRQ